MHNAAAGILTCIKRYRVPGPCYVRRAGGGFAR